MAFDQVGPIRLTFKPKSNGVDLFTFLKDEYESVAILILDLKQNLPGYQRMESTVDSQYIIWTQSSQMKNSVIHWESVNAI